MNISLALLGIAILATVPIIRRHERKSRQDRADELSYRARLASPLNGDVWPGIVLNHERSNTPEA